MVADVSLGSAMLAKIIVMLVVDNVLASDDVMPSLAIREYTIQ